MFGFKIEVSNADELANRYLKEATQRKKEDINAAITLLKKAYNEIAKIKFDYSVEVFLRLPMYLQVANRSDEAMVEFEKLLQNGYINQNRKKELIPMTDSTIYDKMRLFFQREKKFQTAVSYGIYSMLLWNLGLHRQKRFNQLYQPEHKEFIKERITPLLKKAKRLDLLNSVVDIFIQELNKLPNIISFVELQKEIDG